MEKSYLIKCRKCNAERPIRIIRDDIIDWLEDGRDHKIVSARKRLDGQWGFQCLCGNNDIMTKQESRAISNPATPKSEEITTIVNNLKIQAPKFDLVEL